MHISFSKFQKPATREKKKVKFRYNDVFKKWIPFTDKQYEDYQKQVESAEKYGYFGYRKDKIEERDLNVLNEEETSKAKETIYKDVEQAIDEANIDTIKDYIDIGYYMTPNIVNSIEKTLEKEYDFNTDDTSFFLKNSNLFTEEQKDNLMKKAKEKALKLSSDYVKDNFKKIEGEHTIEQDLKNVNPKYAESGSYRINCQRCSFAYELRRRGYDVEANPNDNGFGSANKWKSQMVFKEEYNFRNSLGPRGVATRIIDKVKNAGEGSRWAIDVQWSRSTNGHIFIAENVGGEVKFFDAQTGNENCINYFNNIAKTKETYIYRMDNADWNYGVKETGFSPKGE